MVSLMMHRLSLYQSINEQTKVYKHGYATTI
jgi:hypothetical protein